MTTSTTTTVHAPARQPFDFGLSLRFVDSFPAMAGEQCTDGGTLTCALRAGGSTVGARISADGAGLRYELHAAGPLGESAVAEVTDRLSFRLGLDDDVAAFYALAAGDPPFQRLVERLHGYHQVKFPSPLELLCWAILGQRAPLPVARRMKQAIVARAANGIVVDGRKLWAFPDLEQLLELTQDELAGLIANRRKAAYLHGAFRHWQEIDESFLRSGDHEQVRQRLLEIPGVGPWSSTFLMVRGLGRTETIGPDREGRLAAGRVYGRTLTDAEIVELAGRYEGWQGYWGHYLRVGG
ncbi:MAG: DNA-3-methyladenine glycosylase [Solirubrobacteraceae bacterium]|jgi:DNA-3-methyladenine glycosylase II|nr:DNA-3-methyladenine glycosylase [Solirubrobacteraceae bacterium]